MELYRRLTKLLPVYKEERVKDIGKKKVLEL